MIQTLDKPLLKDVLGDERTQVYIPHYQREYSWKTVGDDEVGQLWNDLLEFRKADSGFSYFMGPILQYPETDSNISEYERYAIVDGQQRLVTVSILLCAMRDAFQSLIEDLEGMGELTGELEGIKAFCEERKKKIQKTYLIKQTNSRNNPNMRKLLLSDNNSDENCFKHYRHHLCKGNDPDFYAAHKNHRINSAYKFFRYKIFAKELAEYNEKEQYNYLNEWFEFIHNKLQFIQIRVAGYVDAFTLFETLNNRGKPLTVADLTKNSLYHRAASLERQMGYRNNTIKTTVDEKWKGHSSVSSFVPKKGTDPISTFILRYWNSTESPKITKGKLYKKIYERLQNLDRDKFEEFLDSLVSNAEAYSQIITPNLTDYTDQKIFYELVWLNYAGIVQHIPLLLACKSRTDIDEEEFYKILKLVNSLFVWHYIVKEGSPSAIENKFCEWAVQLRNADSGIESISRIKAQAKDFIFDEYGEDDFINDFSKLNIDNTKRIQFILRKLEMQASNREIDLFKEPKKVQVEHVLPKSMGHQEWTEHFEPHEHSEYLWRLGNLTLFLGRYNLEALNRPFSQKKEIYPRSEVKLTSSSEKYGIMHEESIFWMKDSIDNRQKALAKLGLQAWTFD